jgi:nucleoside-diphosphate-sugar epimerase
MNSLILTKSRRFEMSVLVTGAAGNVGYITAAVCEDAGLEVVAHDRKKCDPNSFIHETDPPSPNNVKALKREKVHEPSGGDFMANFTYVKDLANAFLLAYQKDSLLHTLYNVSNGRYYTVAQVADAIREVLPVLNWKWDRA